jgi:outer membrane immunogenic protein
MAVAGTALAADVDIIYAPAHPSAAPFAIFTGCYGGFNVGGVFSRFEPVERSPVPFSPGSQTHNAVAGGGQVGCDYQYGSWVFGIQGMFDATGLRGSSIQFLGVTGLTTLSNKASWLATGTGRIGYTVQPAVLFYLKGGSGMAQNQRTGWTVGSGLEWQALPALSLFVEYDFLNFGTKNEFFNTVPPLSVNAGLNLYTLLVGANFRFDLGSFVTTRY